jgi:hypothetical protein
MQALLSWAIDQREDHKTGHYRPPHVDRLAALSGALTELPGLAASDFIDNVLHTSVALKAARTWLSSPKRPRTAVP